MAATQGLGPHLLRAMRKGHGRIADLVAVESFRNRAIPNPDCPEPILD